MVCALLSVQAQQSSLYTINGMVVSAKDGIALPAATVKIKDTNRGITTDNYGRFTLQNVQDTAVLIVSSIGYASQEITADIKNPMIIRLIPSVNKLDETVIMGYGTTTQRLNTGDISTITAKEISEQPVTNVLAALSGRAPGVYVQTQNGLPGGNITVQIRGINSIGAGNDPLYIIDGVPYPSTPLNNGLAFNGAAGNISPLNSINPDDIQSIEILKDADATAIYGSRGSNGVILITTKKGQSGKTRFQVNISQGFSRLNQQTNYLNLKQYLQLRREAFKNDGVEPTTSTAPDLLVWDTTKSTDWQKYLFGRTDPVTEAQASISGGNTSTHFLLSGNFHREGSIYRGNFHYSRAGSYFNMEHTSPNQKFHTTFTTSYEADNNDLPQLNLLSSLSLPPDFPLYDSMGNLNWNGASNPLGVLKQTTQAKTNNLVSNLILRYSILKGLDIKVSLGFNKLSLTELSITPKTAQAPSSYATNSADWADMSTQSYIIEPQINYVRKIGNGSLTMLAGGTWQYTGNQNLYIQTSNYSNESLLGSLGAAGTINSVNNTNSVYKYASIFGRVNYNWQDKYIINGSFRRDGSSRFGPGKQFGNFGAAGAAWLFSNEHFIKESIPFLSYGKLRASYGLTGNDRIADYGFLSTYSSGSIYNNIATLRPTRAANPDYSWETNKKMEAAIELGFLKDRIMLSTAWYRNRSSNELVSYPLPTQTGFSSYQANLPALVGNKGWEFDFNSTNITTHNFNWQTSFNITFSNNKLISFPGIESSSYAYQYQVGQDLSVHKGYLFTGVNPKTGIAQFKDVNNDGVLNNKDRVVIGKSSPDFYGGFNNTLSYKGITLSVFFQFAKQQNNTLTPAMIGMSNYMDAVLKRWQKPGDITSIQKPTATFGSPASATIFNMLFSSATFSDASYIRFKNISLDYQLKSHWIQSIRAEDCKIYLQFENLITWAANNNYRLDPETTAQSIPPLKTFVLGLQLSF
ncbi:MAG: SusC/RagA family TonB-linked outer membrane protein [Chitinophagaceae bacterium]|nr:MAG: SusC/RagA family TonB-linked outer membrane protein [Chitinophagaceae bacterium]